MRTVMDQIVTGRHPDAGHSDCRLIAPRPLRNPPYMVVANADAGRPQSQAVPADRVNPSVAAVMHRAAADGHVFRIGQRNGIIADIPEQTILHGHPPAARDREAVPAKRFDREPVQRDVLGPVDGDGRPVGK